MISVHSPQSTVHGGFVVSVKTGDRGPGTGDR
jgi:hypothetical protein